MGKFLNFIMMMYYAGLIGMASEESREHAMRGLCGAIKKKDKVNRRLKEVLFAKEEVNEKLQSATRAKTEFISNVSHGKHQHLL